MDIMRKKIIDTLGNALKNNPLVFAFWLEGADAHGMVDAYSDMDVWFDVKDGHERMIFEQLQEILSTIAPVDFDHEVKHPHPKIRQRFFHLKDTSEFLIIDVCIQSHSREFWFTQEHADEKVTVIFDKDEVIQFRDMDKSAFQKEQEKRVAELKKTHVFFQSWVKKEIKRGNFLEALNYYHNFVLEPLIELLRICYIPTKREFGLKHIGRDLPGDAVSILEDLYKISGISDITEKMQKANQLFFDKLKEMEKK